jgi:hypothetical protein
MSEKDENYRTNLKKIFGLFFERNAVPSSSHWRKENS